MSSASLRFATDQERKIKKENSRATFSPEIILDDKSKLPKSSYAPDDKEKEVLSLIRKNFQEGDAAMRRPRREFNDLDLLTRTQIDRMGFNSYQPNDGDPLDGNESLAWRSNAMRPVQRNKVISIAAHATARLVFPKVFAWDEESEEQRDAAQVMEDLMEWSGDQSNYAMTGLYATINALVEPASIIYTEYEETYRQVKGEKLTTGYEVKTILDEDLSGFQDVTVPCDELYIENFYEHDIQKQGWLIWRRVHSYSLLRAKYGHCENFTYVKPGIQILYDDADRTFYEVYDATLRGTMGEEVLYFNRTLDLKLTVVNGVMMTPSDNPNPRIDKRYPFVKFGYELIDGGRFFYYKSLTFKVSQDAKIINSLYPMIIDGTYLSIMPPVGVTGQDMIASDVFIPGAVTTLSAGADVKPFGIASNLQAGMNAMFKVDQSLSETAGDQYTGGTGQDSKKNTAYGISIIQQNANTLLGPFLQMIAGFVKDYGKLKISDILQYMTIADVSRIEGSAGAPLIYKTFILPNKSSGGKNVTRSIKFDSSLPSEAGSETDHLKLSYEAMDKSKDDKELYRVNPQLFRTLKFSTAVNPDILNPMSEEMEAQMNLEAYDRAINNPILNQEEVAREFLLGSFKKSKRNPDRFINKQTNPLQQILGGAQGAQMPQQGTQTPAGQPQNAMPMQMPTRPTTAQVAQ